MLDGKVDSFVSCWALYTGQSSMTSSLPAGHVLLCMRAGYLTVPLQKSTAGLAYHAL